MISSNNTNPSKPMPELSQTTITAIIAVTSAVIGSAATIAAQVLAKRREHTTAVTLKVMELALRLRETEVERALATEVVIFPIEFYLAYIRQCAELAGKPHLDNASIAKLGANMEALGKLIMERDGVTLPSATFRSHNMSTPTGAGSR